MKMTLVFAAAAALVSTTAWAQSNVIPVNPYPFASDNDQHILNDLPQPAGAMKGGQTEYYGTSQQTMGSSGMGSSVFSRDEAGSILLDVRPELVPAWNPR